MSPYPTSCLPQPSSGQERKQEICEGIISWDGAKAHFLGPYKKVDLDPLTPGQAALEASANALSERVQCFRGPWMKTTGSQGSKI